IQFDRAPSDINALCRDAATAAEVSAPGAAVTLDLDPSMPSLTTDAERLRIALVNMLVNARHAVNGAAAAAAVSLSTRAAADRVSLVIANRGEGISPEALAHIFDPYFTTKRGGTGLGLPIAKNIVEGLGGSIAISSAPGRGTEVRINTTTAATR